MNQRVFGCLGLLAVLAGCGPGYQWAKPGVTADLAAADYNHCRRIGDIEANRRYGGWLDWLRTERSFADTRVVGRQEVSPALEARFEEDRVRRDQDIYRGRVVRDCMESGGYSLVPMEAAGS